MSRIITFYSYKGGVGRTSAMANVAVLLAQQGKNVLLMDWDLEAPGLDRFFRQHFQSSRSQRGLIHLLSESQENPSVEWGPYVSEIRINGYSISLIPSGDTSPDYDDRVRAFSWAEFFSHHRGGEILDRWRDEWKSIYDFVLIDSRTGVTDVGGVCTVFLPDILVLVFTANDQSFEGALRIATAAQNARRGLSVPRPPVAILPLPGRFDARDEVDTANLWLERFSRGLKPFYDDWLPKQFEARRILELTKIPYVTKYSFGESLAVLEQSLSDPDFPGYYLNHIARLIASDFSEVDQILLPASTTTRRPESTTDVIKNLLPSPIDRMRLDDFVSDLLRKSAVLLSSQNFPPNGAVTDEEFASRIKRYEDALSDLLIAVVLLARWATDEQVYLLDKIFERVAEFDKATAGTVIWIRLYWYPVLGSKPINFGAQAKQS